MDPVFEAQKDHPPRLMVSGGSVFDERIRNLMSYALLWVTMATTIQLQPETKSRLDELKIHPRESYDETLNRLLDIAYDPEPLSEETLQQIEEGIADIRAGRLRSLEDIALELGLE